MTSAVHSFTQKIGKNWSSNGIKIKEKCTYLKSIKNYFN